MTKRKHHLLELLMTLILDKATPVVTCSDGMQEFAIDTGDITWQVFAEKVGDRWEIDSWINIMN